MSQDRKRSHHQMMGAADVEQAGALLVEHLKNTPAENSLVLYIHIPYCFKICSFCSLRRSLNQPATNYASTIAKEVRKYAELPFIQSSTVDSLYFGGGTPTTLSDEDFALVLRTLNEHIQYTKDAERSVESTLTELDERKQKVLREGGINRLSIGVQSFDDRARKLFNRRGDSNFAIQRLKEIKGNGFESVNIDLIYNYEQQTIESIRRDVALADELGCSGFSMYSLMNMKDKEQLKTGDLEREKKLFNALVDEAIKRGFSFFEATKMVKDDQYKYMKNRLSGSSTVPLGAGAGGSMNRLAIMNPIDITQYEYSVSHFDEKKGMLMGKGYEKLSQLKGSLQLLHLPKKYMAAHPGIQSYVERCVKDGLMIEESEQYTFTKKSIFRAFDISNTILSIIQGSKKSSTGHPAGIPKSGGHPQDMAQNMIKSNDDK